MLVVRHVADRNQLGVEAPTLARRGPPLLGAEREGILLLARDAPALGHVLARLAHRLEREQLRQLRVREPPAERRVVHDAVAARERAVRLRGREWRAGHRLDAAGDEEVAVAR